MFGLTIRALPMNVNASAAALGRPIMSNALDYWDFFLGSDDRPTIVLRGIVRCVAFFKFAPQLRLALVDLLTLAIEQRSPDCDTVCFHIRIRSRANRLSLPDSPGDQPAGQSP